MAYIDGFVMAVPTDRKAAFLDHARQVDALFLKHGALRVVECWGDDVPDGEVTSFPMAVKRSEDETVVFAWIEWPDKETRDKTYAALQDEPLFGPDGIEMPFDGKRMIYGGFTPIFDLSKE